MATASILPLSTLSAMIAAPEPPRIAPEPFRRRASLEQGRALETLGHAIEYLIDSRLPEGGLCDAGRSAVRILMVCSRNVFEEAEVFVPVHQRVGEWFQQRLRRRVYAPAPRRAHC